MTDWFSDFTHRDLDMDEPDANLEPSDDKTFNRFILACVIVLVVLYGLSFIPKTERQREWLEYPRIFQALNAEAPHA